MDRADVHDAAEPSPAHSGQDRPGEHARARQHHGDQELPALAQTLRCEMTRDAEADAAGGAGHEGLHPS
jgi:hypothetical protein